MRKLNEEELAIIATKEDRLNKKYGESDLRFDIEGVEYRNVFPRTTVCLLLTEKQTYDDYGNLAIGIAMRAKNEPDIPHNGEVIAFVRALDAASPL